MANINNLKIGSSNPDALMLDKPYQPMANQFTSFGSIVAKDNTNDTVSPNLAQWEINDDCDVEIISPRKIRIKKFKIDTWILRIKTGNIPYPSDWASFRIKVEGLTYLNENVICHTAGSTTPDGFTNAYIGTGGWNVSWYPGQYTSGNYARGLLIQGCMNYTSNATERDQSLHMGRAPWDIGSYSFITDGEVSTKALYGIGCKGICIGLFGGIQNATAYDDSANGAYKVYDISDNPLTIDLDVMDTSAAIDYSSVEVWDAYIGSTQVYHKDKTIDNCLKKYKYVKEVTAGSDTQNQIIKDASMGDNIFVPIPVDFADFFGNNNCPTFNISASNSEFWDEVKQYVSSIGIVVQNTDYENLKGVFQGCNMSGAVTVKILNDGNVAGDRMFENCPVSEINFTYKNDTDPTGEGMNRITSANTLFKSTPNLQTITSTYHIWARDLSGCFEYSGIQEIPGIINYSFTAPNNITIGDDNVLVNCSLTSWFCDGCSSLTKVDRSDYATDRENGNNVITLSTGYYMFNGCSSLTTIDPVLNMIFARPSNASRMFNNCSVLADVRIQNLNHGDWHFDDNSQQGNLPALNQESVEYLFSNLYDLTTRDPDMVYIDGSTEGTTNNGNQYAANPDVSAANLYCPSSWDTYITSEMISAANAKGWTIYVGGMEVQPS